MQWIEVSVPTRSDEIDDVCAQLAELGAGGMVVEDEADFQQFLEQNHQECKNDPALSPGAYRELQPAEAMLVFSLPAS